MKPIKVPWPLMTFEDPQRGLNEIAAALNQGGGIDPRFTSITHAKLLRLVRAWKDSGPNLLKMKVRQDDNFEMSEQWKAWRCNLVPTSSGRAYISLSPTGENYQDVVAFYFVRLIINPQCVKLTLCENCQQWFVKKTMKGQYCSRLCGSNVVKVRARRKDHERKLGEAMQAIKNYKSRPTRFSSVKWKDWVSEGVPGISSKWLTRAVNAGDLVPPKSESMHRTGRAAN